MKRWLLLLTVLLLVAGCAPVDSTTATQKGSLLDREIVVGYINYPPGLSVDPSSQKISGIMHDVLQEIALRSGAKIRFSHETTWATMIEELDSGKIDLVCTGLWPNAARARRALFSDAVYYSPVHAYASTQAAYAKLGSNDAALKLATIDGEMSSIIARDDYPAASVVSLPQSTEVAQLLLEIQSGKAEVTFVEPYLANRFLAANPGALYSDPAAAPVRVFANAFMTRRGNEGLVAFLDTAIEELHNTGFIERALRKYVPGDGEVLRVADRYER